jgi:hypothetical protein
MAAVPPYDLETTFLKANLSNNKREETWATARPRSQFVLEDDNGQKVPQGIDTYTRILRGRFRSWLASYIEQQRLGTMADELGIANAAVPLAPLELAEDTVSTKNPDLRQMYYFMRAVATTDAQPVPGPDLDATIGGCKKSQVHWTMYAQRPRVSNNPAFTPGTVPCLAYAKKDGIVATSHICNERLHTILHVRTNTHDLMDLLSSNLRWNYYSTRPDVAARRNDHGNLGDARQKLHIDHPLSVAWSTYLQRYRPRRNVNNIQPPGAAVAGAGILAAPMLALPLSEPNTSQILCVRVWTDYKGGNTNHWVINCWIQYDGTTAAGAVVPAPKSVQKSFESLGLDPVLAEAPEFYRNPLGRLDCFHMSAGLLPDPGQNRYVYHDIMQMFKGDHARTTTYSEYRRYIDRNALNQFTGPVEAAMHESLQLLSLVYVLTNAMSENSTRFKSAMARRAALQHRGGGDELRALTQYLSSTQIDDSFSRHLRVDGDNSEEQWVPHKAYKDGARYTIDVARWNQASPFFLASRRQLPVAT